MGHATPCLYPLCLVFPVRRALTPCVSCYNRGACVHRYGGGGGGYGGGGGGCVPIPKALFLFIVLPFSLERPLARIEHFPSRCALHGAVWVFRVPYH
jgi:hypothetical protein